jgi:ligand-binding sensor domain-containing protein
MVVLILAMLVPMVAPPLAGQHPVVLAQEDEHWSNFTAGGGPAANSILDIQTSGDYLWVGATSGVSVRAPDGAWGRLSIDDGLAGNLVTAIATDPANPRLHWFATNGGASLLDDGGDPLDKAKHRWVTFGKRDGLLDHRLSSVTLAPNGEIWFGLAYTTESHEVRVGHGISVLNVHGTPFDKTDDTWHSLSAANSDLTSDVVFRLATDAAGIIWIATQSGLHAYQNDQWTLFSSEQGLPSNEISALAFAGKQVWVGASKGLGLLDYGGALAERDDDRWQTYPLPEHLATNVSALAFDANGHLWGGVNLFSGASERNRMFVVDLQGTPFDVSDDNLLIIDAQNVTRPRAIAVAGEKIWLAADQGLQQVTYSGSTVAADQLQWSNQVGGRGLLANVIGGVAPHRGDGMAVLADGRTVMLRYGFSPHNLRDDHILRIPEAPTAQAIAIDQKKRLWFASGTNLVVLDMGERIESTVDDERRLYNASNGLNLAEINELVIDGQNRAWIATGDYFRGALHVLAVGDSTKESYDDQMATFTPQNSGLPGSYVTTVAFGQNNDVWVGTTVGVAHLRYGASPFQKQTHQWTTYTTETSNIGSDWVRDIAPDEAGNVWFALATGGVSVYTTTEDWISFTEADGLVFNSVNAVAADHQGNFWFGTDGEGISVLDTAGTLADKGDDHWRTYPPGQPLLTGYIKSITVDRWGQVWIGTLGGGLSLYSTVGFQNNYLPLVSTP